MAPLSRYHDGSVREKGEAFWQFAANFSDIITIGEVELDAPGEEKVICPWDEVEDNCGLWIGWSWIRELKVWRKCSMWCFTMRAL